jgi:hypothetical protein
MSEHREVRFGSAPKAPAALHMSMELEWFNGKLVIQEHYLTGYQGHFVRLLCTNSVASKTNCEMERTRLVNAIGKLLTGP